MLYQCTHEGCTKRYATTDAVKKHAKKAHPDWQLPDCRKRGEGPTFYKEVDPSTDAVQGTVVQAGAGGGESTEVSPEMALNPVLIASWTSAEVKTALFDAVVKKHVLPAELHYVHMTDDQRKKWEELFHADNVKSPFVDQTPRLVTVVLRNEHGQSEPLEVSFNLLVRLLDEKGWKGIKEEVLTNQYWIAMCIRLAKKEQLRYGMGLKKMKALAFLSMLLDQRQRVVHDRALAVARPARGADDSERHLFANDIEEPLMLTLVRRPIGSTRLLNVRTTRRVVWQVRDRLHLRYLLWKIRHCQIY